MCDFFSLSSRVSDWRPTIICRRLSAFSRITMRQQIPQNSFKARLVHLQTQCGHSTFASSVSIKPRTRNVAVGRVGIIRWFHQSFTRQQPVIGRMEKAFPELSKVVSKDANNSRTCVETVRLINVTSSVAISHQYLQLRQLVYILQPYAEADGKSRVKTLLRWKLLS